MRSGFIAVSAKFLDLKPFRRVTTVFLSCVSRDTRRSFGGIGPAFCALKSDHNPDALVFCHKGRDAEKSKRNYEPRSYKPVGT